jgi:hypothetical protein
MPSQNDAGLPSAIASPRLGFATMDVGQFYR